MSTVTLSRIRSDLSAAEQALEAAQSRVDRLRRLWADIVAEYPDEDDSVSGSDPGTHNPADQTQIRSAPVGQEAIRVILRESNGWMTAAEIYRARLALGWSEPASGADPVATTRKTIRRLIANGELTRRRRGASAKEGEYRLKEPGRVDMKTDEDPTIGGAFARPPEP